METEEPLSARRWGPGSREVGRGRAPCPHPAAPRVPVTNACGVAGSELSAPRPGPPWSHMPAVGPRVSAGARRARPPHSKSQGPAERGWGRGRVPRARSPPAGSGSAWRRLQGCGPRWGRARGRGAGPHPPLPSFRLTENMRRLSEYRALGGAGGCLGAPRRVSRADRGGFLEAFFRDPHACPLPEAVAACPRRPVCLSCPPGVEAPGKGVTFPGRCRGPGCDPRVLPVGTGVGWGHAEGLSPRDQAAPGRAGGPGSPRARRLLCRSVRPGPAASLPSQGCLRARGRRPDRASACPQSAAPGLSPAS